MSDEDKTPTDKPIPPVPAPTGAPTINVEEDAAGELHDAPTVETPAPAAVELCGARCGTAKIFCGLEAGHEDPAHPDHVKNEHGEALHVAREVRWPVDVAAAEAAGNERMRQLFEASKKAKIDAGEV